MTRGRYITEWAAGAGLAIAIAASLPSLALDQAAHPPQQRHQAPAYHPAPPPSRPPAARPPQPASPQQGHAGDWLRHYKDLPPAEQDRALQNDPWFQRLPSERQQQLRQRLQNFSNLPPQRQLRVLNRMDTWEHLTPEQKQQARQVFGEMRQLPPDRRRLVHKAIDDLRAMPPQQRDQVIESERFKGVFSDHERDMMRQASRLPLATADSGDAGPEE